MNKRKKVFYSELAYVFGILLLALSASTMERADFGMSMIVAPAYIIHLKVSHYLSWYTFGVSEYILQGVLIILLSAILKKFKVSYLFSFVTAVIYGYTLDLIMMLTAMIPDFGIPGQIIFFILGIIFGAFGVALVFHTYIPPEAYELLVKEISQTKKIKISKVKTIYDLSSTTLSVILSFSFFGFLHFEGIKLGTLFCAIINGYLIGKVSTMLENKFDFRDRFPLRKFFS